MALSLSDQQRLLAAARVLLQERKTLAVGDLATYLREVAHLALAHQDIEESLLRLFERPQQQLTAIALHQAMLFRRAALAHWYEDEYAFLVIEDVYVGDLPGPGKQADPHPVREHVYLLFGIAGQAPGKFLGLARSPREVLDFVKSQSIDLRGWLPLDDEQWKSLIPSHDPRELVRQFGPLLFQDARPMILAL